MTASPHSLPADIAPSTLLVEHHLISELNAMISEKIEKEENSSKSAQQNNKFTPTILNSARAAVLGCFEKSKLEAYESLPYAHLAEIAASGRLKYNNRLENRDILEVENTSVSLQDSNSSSNKSDSKKSVKNSKRNISQISNIGTTVDTWLPDSVDGTTVFWLEGQ